MKKIQEISIVLLCSSTVLSGLEYNLKYLKDCQKPPLPYHEKPCATLLVDLYLNQNKRQLLKGNVSVQDYCPDCRFCIEAKKDRNPKAMTFKDLECQNPLIRVMFQAINMPAVSGTSDCRITLGNYTFKDVDISTFDRAFQFPYRLKGTFYSMFYMYDEKKLIHFCKELKLIISSKV